MKQIAIYGRSFDDEYIEGVTQLFEELRKREFKVWIFTPFSDFLKSKVQLELEYKIFESFDEIEAKVECLFSIGGDGTMLDSVALVGKSGIPLLGINTGRLGFLSTIKLEGIKQALDAIESDDFELEDRLMLELDTMPNLFDERSFGLNEVVVHKKDSSSMIAIHAYIDGEMMNTYWADGLIISSPTGSTAYSMSCGGPIVIPGSQNFIITPVSPHSLTSRPYIVNSDSEIKLKVEGRGKDFLVSIDSRMETFDSSLEICIRKCKFSTKLVRMKGQTFLKTLNNKLNWGLDQRN